MAPTSAIIVLVPAAAFATFDSRHQLPQLTLILVAAIFGVNIVTKSQTASSQSLRR